MNKAGTPESFTPNPVPQSDVDTLRSRVHAFEVRAPTPLLPRLQAVIASRYPAQDRVLRDEAEQQLDSSIKRN